MLQSPFVILTLFLLLFSCEEKTTVPFIKSSIEKEAQLLQEKGIKNFQNKKFDSSFYNFNKSKIIFESIDDSTNIAYNLIQMASIQQINGDYYGCKETLTEALPYIQNDNNYLTATNNLFGIAYKELSLYDDALFYYKKALTNAKDTLSKQAPLNNIAVVNILQKKYNNAIGVLESILDNNRNNKLPQTREARILDNLGFAYFKQGNLDKSLALIDKGLALRKQADDSYGIIQSNLHLAEYYTTIDPQKSNQKAQMAYHTATEFNSIDDRLKALSFLISNNYNEKDKQYDRKYVFLNDSIIKVRNNFKNKFAKIKYDSKKEKDENQKLRLEKAENLLSLQKVKYQRMAFVIGIFSLVITIVILSRYYKNRNRIEKIRASYDTETRIAKKIHDELANDVFHAITFAQTQSLSVESVKENLLQKLDQIYTRVRGISRENNNIDTGINYSKCITEMLSTYNSENINVIINNTGKINWNFVDKIRKITIYRVLQELMINMKKHSQASLVVIKLDYYEMLFIEYVDNGIGCNKDKIIKNGLQNMENRILALKGTIIFDSKPEKGFKVKIRFPK